MGVVQQLMPPKHKISRAMERSLVYVEQELPNLVRNISDKPEKCDINQFERQVLIVKRKLVLKPKFPRFWIRISKDTSNAAAIALMPDVCLL